MITDYPKVKITRKQAEFLSEELFGIQGVAMALPGEIDFNFRIESPDQSYLLKVARPGTEQDYLEFQQAILQHVARSPAEIISPVPLPNLRGNFISEIKDKSGNIRKVRLLTWVKGRLWSGVNPVNDKLLFSLGEEAGRLTRALQGFEHPLAERDFEWDLAQSGWTGKYEHLFSGEKLEILRYFREKFNGIQASYMEFRKSVVHNDANDNNVVVSEDLADPKVRAIIDFGDAIHTQIINDVAVTIAYAVMGKPDPLGAAIALVKGYHKHFPLLEEELEVLYVLVAMRLVLSVSKSAINREMEPDNQYLLISEAPAWELLRKWKSLSPGFAHYGFRQSCGFSAHPQEKLFMDWAAEHPVSLISLLPSIQKEQVHPLDLSVSGTWIGDREEAGDQDLFQFRIDRLQKEVPEKIIAGGYLEPRALYNTESYDRTGNKGKEKRSIHLGIDLWVPPSTPVHTLFDGEVVVAANNKGDRQYGGLIILKHQAGELCFYTLYGHLTVKSALKHRVGDQIKQGEQVGVIGDYPENGNWPPHLHFQLMLSRLSYVNDFPGVAYPGERELLKSICPDPNLLFRQPGLEAVRAEDLSETIAYRRKHLGKGLSLSYEEPLKMVRGDGIYLIDHQGRKFLDTVNNVAHVGHEHPRVVRTGQRQMAVLNTNTRYLHDNIHAFSRELLSTFPEELSVVHVVNSGSEANELALRMARTCTGQKDMIAMEVGYHGNTTGCVSISSYKFDGKGGSGAPEHTHIVPLPDRFRGIHKGENSGPLYAAHMQEQIDHIHARGRKPAGFICESIISCGGQIELPEHFLEMAYASVRKAGGICMADEVQVGCGRTGRQFWGFQLHGVIPDIVTIGKPIGNGHPLAAVVCTREVADAFANGMEYFNTFGGNPVSCAIGTEVLRVIREEKLQENALDTGSYLKNELKKMQKEFPLVGDVRGQGLFLGIELTDNQLNPQTDKAAYLARRMKELGILMSTDGKDVNVMKIKPPLVFSREHADQLLETLRRIFREDFMQL
ncbi:MAG: aminotransferase class III-fold pyridoxal phosphate-dependent enzyme [Bacteroidales bacterium]|nr:aminotransferase class III-fold pyridoxal phosphate-dependent enzyme [Bacteroidales bacterium]